MHSRIQHILILAIMIFIAFKASAQIPISDNVCVGEERHYWVDSLVVEGLTYTWTINNVIQQNGSVNLFPITWNTTGTYLLKAQITSAENCVSEVESGWIYVHPMLNAPTIVIVQPNCGLVTGMITVTAPQGIGMTYSIGGTYQSNMTFGDLATGIYTVTAKNPGGCISPETLVTLKTSYPELIVTTDNTASICSGMSTNINLNASSASSFRWEIGAIAGGITGANSGTGTSIKQTLTNSSNTLNGTVEYIVTPTSLSSLCIGIADTITITVNPTPEAIAGADRSICMNENTKLGAASVMGSSYRWSSIPAGFTSTLANPMVNPLTTTTYTVEEISTVTGCQKSNHVIVDMNIAPSIIMEPSSQIINFGDPVNFSVVVLGPVFEYQWRRGVTNLIDGGNISGVTSSTLTINPTTYFDIAADYNVVITGICPPVITSAYISLWICDYCTDIVSFEDISLNKTISIYPNPFSTSIKILRNDASRNIKYELMIYNVNGEEVIQTTIVNQLTTLETTYLRSGIYFYTVLDNEKIIQSGKLISNR